MRRGTRIATLGLVALVTHVDSRIGLAQPSTAPGCRADIECKGDRICDEGVCRSPDDSTADTADTDSEANASNSIEGEIPSTPAEPNRHDPSNAPSEAGTHARSPPQAPQRTTEFAAHIGLTSKKWHAVEFLPAYTTWQVGATVSSPRGGIWTGGGAWLSSGTNWNGTSDFNIVTAFFVQFPILPSLRLGPQLDSSFTSLEYDGGNAGITSKLMTGFGLGLRGEATFLTHIGLLVDVGARYYPGQEVANFSACVALAGKLQR